MSLYVLKNIRRQYAGRMVLDIPELSLEAGTVYTLTGPNGAGKTTLLRLLGFLAPPSSGEMTFKGRPVQFTAAAMGRFRKSVVLVDQHPILFSTTVYKNVEFGLNVRKVPKELRKQIIASALDRVGMKAFANADARCLSGGETRRVAIARALACGPEVLLMDEPTADLDIEHQWGIETIIRDIHRQHPVTIVFCTHNLAQGLRLTPHHIHLFSGRLREVEHENVFKGETVTVLGRHYCKIAEKVLIPVPPTDKRETKISIHPDAVRMADETRPTPDPPLLMGKVVVLSADKDRIRATVDVGVPLTLTLTAADYTGRDIRVNTTLAVAVDPAGVTLL